MTTDKIVQVLQKKNMIQGKMEVITSNQSFTVQPVLSNDEKFLVKSTLDVFETVSKTYKGKYCAANARSGDLRTAGSQERQFQLYIYATAFKLFCISLKYMGKKSILPLF